MNRSLLVITLFAALAASACDKQPTVVNVPVPVAVPGPAGPQGASGGTGMTGATGDTGAKGTTGSQGAEGSKGDKGDAGKTGGSTAVIVIPPAAPTPEPAK